MCLVNTLALVGPGVLNGNLQNGFNFLVLLCKEEVFNSSQPEGEQNEKEEEPVSFGSAPYTKL